MRTKTLVLTAAISAAALATSMAQIFSVNAVGYVKLTIGANNLALIANPLNQANNNLDLILPLKDDGTQDGVAIYRFDPVTSSYYSAIAWQSIDPTTPGSGGFWFTADGHTNPKVVNPGEGFFIWNITAAPVDLTFVGEVMQGNLSNPVPGAGALSIRSSLVPQSAGVGDATGQYPASLLFPAVDGDTIYVYNVATQAYADAYSYTGPDPTIPSPGFWFSASDSNAAGPVIPVAGSFFVLKAGPAVQNWTRTFSVN